MSDVRIDALPGVVWRDSLSGGDYYVPAADLLDLQENLAAAEDEIRTLTTAGIIEVAVRNPSVNDYMHYWERRAEKAEARVKVLTDALGVVADGNAVDYTDNWKIALAALKDADHD